ncbi:tyrosine-type recombinase/integrase [Paraburkholderia sp. EG287B]|uniref:tyrosine-type recombinase/integrase n=1 Tax=unclassified Paraburkholderia TaxID=2615204 RepID=UPI0034D1E50A
MISKDLICRFLDTLSIGPETRSDYARALRKFESFMSDKTLPDEESAIEVLRTWMRQEIQKSPLSGVENRARVVVRYLEWRTNAGGGSHPVLELYAHYGRSIGPVVRALLEDDNGSALRRLIPLPVWGSVLGPAMQEHVGRMKSLGYRYDTRASDLQRFDRFLQQHPALATVPLRQQLDAWRNESPGLRHQYLVQQCGVALSKALRRKAPEVPTLLIEPGLYGRLTQQERRPYLFTEAEIRMLLDAARTFPSPKAPLRPVALHAMMTLAYCAGLRLGEIASLTVGDLDLARGLLVVRETKFFKSRRLALSPSALDVLRAYVEARAAFGAPITPGAPLWWSPLRRSGYCKRLIEWMLTEVIRRAGLKPAHGHRGPRVHDIRHTFVGHRMMQWYRAGINPQDRLPHLAAYLGHKDIRSTLAYLNISPELLRQASERYRRHNASMLRSPGESS